MCVGGGGGGGGGGEFSKISVRERRTVKEKKEKVEIKRILKSQCSLQTDSQGKKKQNLRLRVSARSRDLRYLCVYHAVACVGFVRDGQSRGKKEKMRLNFFLCVYHDVACVGFVIARHSHFIASHLEKKLKN